MRKVLFTLFVVCAFSCAREESESLRTLEERLLEARVQVKYLDTLHKTGSGLYYMIQAKGSGEAVKKENHVYVHYSVLDFFNEGYLKSEGSSNNNNNNYYNYYDYYDYYGYNNYYNYYDYPNYYGYGSSSSTTEPKLLSSEERVAKQMGAFSYTTHYGPVLWFAGANALMEGIDEMILSMKEGDRRRIWLPSWLSSYGYSGSGNRYSVTTIHDVEIVRVVPDIEQFQIDTLESYRDKYYPGIDSLSWGFYKKTLVAGSGDTLKTGNKVRIRFVGRLLDDFIFDLNIADTAKKYNIFSSSKTYDPYEGECMEDEQVNVINPSTGESSPFCPGFSKAIFTMKHGEEAVVFFHSVFGYGAEEGIDNIQPFSPLVFYIRVERTNFDDNP